MKNRTIDTIKSLALKGLTPTNNPTNEDSKHSDNEDVNEDNEDVNENNENDDYNNNSDDLLSNFISDQNYQNPVDNSVGSDVNNYSNASLVDADDFLNDYFPEEDDPDSVLDIFSRYQ